MPILNDSHNWSNSTSGYLYLRTEKQSPGQFETALKRAIFIVDLSNRDAIYMIKTRKKIMLNYDAYKAIGNTQRIAKRLNSEALRGKGGSYVGGIEGLFHGCFLWFSTKLSACYSCKVLALCLTQRCAQG